MKVWENADYQFPWYVDYGATSSAKILGEQNLEVTYIYTGGLHIYTTLDANVQRAIEKAYADDSNFPSSSTGDIVESGDDHHRTLYRSDQRFGGRQSL